jgi:hypothetical protein
MLKVCETCKFHTDAEDVNTCPSCDTALRPIYLTSPDALDRSDASLPWRPEKGRSSDGSKGPWEYLIESPLGLLAVFFLIVVGAWAMSDWLKGSGPEKKSDNSKGIRIGMHISEVGRILDNGPAPKPSYPRQRDWFPADEFGDGTITYEGDGVILTIEFVGGYVTSIDESPSSAGPGMHRFQTIVRQR